MFFYLYFALILATASNSFGRGEECTDALVGANGDAKREASVEAKIAPLQVPQAPDLFRSDVIGAIVKALPENSGLTAEKVEALLEIPPRFELGQLAFPCFTLAKALKTAPAKIAESIRTAILKDLPPIIQSVTVAGSYLNFSADFNMYARWLNGRLQNGSFFTTAFSSPSQVEKINIEFSQPNTHKALHVGHLRNMVYGESMARLLEGAGHDIIRSTYPGDLGTHVAKVLWYIRDKALPSENQASWMGRMYAEADAFVRAHEDKPEAGDIKKAIELTLKQIQEKQDPMYSLYRTTREWSINQMHEVYDWLGIRFDQWFFESECDEPSRILVEQKFKEGLFTRTQGAVGIDLAPYGLPFALVLTSSGNGLYLTKDLELLRLKFADPTVTRSLVVVDDRQKLHFQQVFKIAELMGFPQATKSIHLAYATVNDANGNAFSSRTMNGMELSQVRELVERSVAPELIRKFGQDIPEAEMQTLVRQYALATLKVGFLRVDAETPIRFDLEEWLKPEGDTAFSLLYLLSELANELKQSPATSSDPVSLEPESASLESENRLLQHLGRYPSIKLDAAQKAKPALVTTYLFELKRLFNTFDAERTASGPRSGATKSAVESTSSVLKHGLNLLGIQTPN